MNDFIICEFHEYDGDKVLQFVYDFSSKNLKVIVKEEHLFEDSLILGMDSISRLYMGLYKLSSTETMENILNSNSFIYNEDIYNIDYKVDNKFGFNITMGIIDTYEDGKFINGKGNDLIDLLLTHPIAWKIEFNIFNKQQKMVAIVVEEFPISLITLKNFIDDVYLPVHYSDIPGYFILRSTV